MHVRKKFKDTYGRLFSSRSLSSFNDFLLEACLRARGYNNFENFESSGEKNFIDHVLRKIRPKVCVDVGANYGNYTRQLLSIDSVTRVYSFEPLSAPYSRLVLMEKQFGERLVAINKGAGQFTEVLPIYYNPKRTSHASVCVETKELFESDNEVCDEIEVTSLDEYFSGLDHETRIDFIKIDTEGFEYEVLLGAQNILSARKPMMIQVEHNLHHLLRGHTFHSFATLLKEYLPFQMLPKRLVCRDPVDPLANIFRFSNFVFVRDDVVKSI